MPHQEKNNKSWNKQLIIFLSATGTLFPKKTLSDKPEENSLDFHLDIINKIDKLLAEHDQQPQSTETVHMPPIIPATPPVPIEPRPSLNKTLSRRENAWEPMIESPRTVTDTIPEEFKTELTTNSEFRFISSREFIETISLARPSLDDHVEIIDLNTLRVDNTGSQKTLDIMNFDDKIDETHSLFSKNKVFDEKRRLKKIEVIDARTLKQKIYEDVFTASTKQAEQIDNKAKLYFLNKKDSSDNKQKKLDIKQSYVPDDFEERFKKIKEKQSKAEENQQHEEKKFIQLKDDPKKIEKIETNKTGFLGKKNMKDSNQVKNEADIKKLEKEQIRLRRLEIRQARIEERLRKKQEKHALKIKQKEQQFRQKEEKNQHEIKKNIFSNKEKYTPSLEFDEEVKKVLLMTDTLLEELPDDVLTDFMHSEDFRLYAKVLNKFKTK